METVTLRNGSTEMKALVIMTYMNLKKMFDDMKGAIAFYELVALCKDSKHEIFPDVQKQYLISRALMQSDGRVHQSIKNVVLSATTGEGVDLSLVNPIATATAI